MNDTTDPDTATPLTAAELDEIDEQAVHGIYASPEDTRRLVAMARRLLELEQAVGKAWDSTRTALTSTQEVPDGPR